MFYRILWQSSIFIYNIEIIFNIIEYIYVYIYIYIYIYILYIIKHDKYSILLITYIYTYYLPITYTDIWVKHNILVF